MCWRNAVNGKLAEKAFDSAEAKEHIQEAEPATTLLAEGRSPIQTL